MGGSVKELGKKSPIDLDDDPVEVVWSVAQKGLHLLRRIAPAVLPMIPKIAASATATNALFAVGAANVLFLYVGVFLAMGSAYAAIRENTKTKGLLMGFCYGVGYSLAGNYSYNDLAWRYTPKGRNRFRREMDQLFRDSYNDGLIEGSSAVAFLKPGNKKIIIQQLEKEIEGRYPSSFDKGTKYAACLHHQFELLMDD